MDGSAKKREHMQSSREKQSKGRQRWREKKQTGGIFTKISEKDGSGECGSLMKEFPLIEEIGPFPQLIKLQFGLQALLHYWRRRRRRRRAGA